MSKSGTVARPDARIFWEEHGDAAGPPVVVLHGAFGAIPSMSAQIPALAARRRVIAIDSRGHGRSSHDGAALHYADMTDDVVAVLDARAIARADVVGWSDGGIVGLDLARRYPARVRNVVAIGANRTPEGLGDHLAKIDDIRADADGMAALHGLYLERAPHPERWPALVAQLKTMLRSEPRWSDDDVAVIRAPVLLLYGEHDDVTPAHGAALARAIPGAALAVVPGATHMLPLQKPDDVNARIERFLG